MADTKPQPVKKSSMSPIAVIGIGCLVLILVLAIGSTLAIRFFAKKIGVGLLQTAIESKTGVKTNLSDLEQGKMTFTDSKTGEKVDIGTGKLPDNFPKNFPIYTGATVASAMSGGQGGKGNGFWVTFSTKDSADKVLAFYKSALSKNGWKTDSTYSMGDLSTMTVSNGTMEGSVAISADSSKKETGIVVTLGDKSGSSDSEPAPQDTPDSGY